MTTSATLGHKNARAYMSMLFENAIIPNSDLIHHSVSEGQ